MTNNQMTQWRKPSALVVRAFRFGSGIRTWGFVIRDVSPPKLADLFRRGLGHCFLDNLKASREPFLEMTLSGN